LAGSGLGSVGGLSESGSDDSELTSILSLSSSASPSVGLPDPESRRPFRSMLVLDPRFPSPFPLVAVCCRPSSLATPPRSPSPAPAVAVAGWGWGGVGLGTGVGVE
jgi:hypothetical protein